MASDVASLNPADIYQAVYENLRSMEVPETLSDTIATRAYLEVLKYQSLHRGLRRLHRNQ